MKHYNLEQQIDALNKAAKSKKIEHLQKCSSRELSEVTICPFDKIPGRICIDRECTDCGTDQIKELYSPLIAAYENDETPLKYYQWEQIAEKYKNRKGEKKSSVRWIQVTKTESILKVIENVAESIKTFTGHVFRTDFQYLVESTLTKNLQLSQCLAVMDFSENITLQAQDEIESAHWVQKQVTLHPIFIVRHAPESTIDSPVLLKESLVIISNHMSHDASAVYCFTEQLMLHLSNNPGPVPIQTIHRFSDNCACQYKCGTAFAHIPILTRKYDIDVRYHYTESGHGKGASDGIGAGIKKRLERLILGGQSINNAYQVYLALRQHPSEARQHIIYVPSRKVQPPTTINQETKQKAVSIKGTQSFHHIKQWKPNTDIIVCSDFQSCFCPVCTTDQQGPCFYQQYRNREHTEQYFDLVNALLCLLLTLNTIIACGDGFTSAVDQSIASHQPQLTPAVDQIIASHQQQLTSTVDQSIASYQQQLANFESALKDFEAKVHAKGWEVRGETPADGNCLFWSLSDQLDRIGLGSITQKQLRVDAISYIRNLGQVEQNRIAGFLTTDLDTYLQNMEKDGTYGDHIIIDAIARHLGCIIQIVQGSDNDIEIGDSDASQRLVIGYLSDSKHYLSLDIRSFQPEDFVSVYLSSKKKRHFYVAKVIEVDDSEARLRFLKPKTPSSSNIYVWATPTDISWVATSDIGWVLSNPELTSDRGIKMKFIQSEIELCKKYMK